MFKEERNKNFPLIQMICDSQGCRYIDENNQKCEPKDQKEISVAEYSKGYIKQKLIEKACKWLETIDFEMEYMNSSDGYTFFDTEKFINDFSKTMEE